jgi:hypothetical protein
MKAWMSEGSDAFLWIAGLGTLVACALLSFAGAALVQRDERSATVGLSPRRYPSTLGGPAGGELLPYKRRAEPGSRDPWSATGAPNGLATRRDHAWCKSHTEREWQRTCLPR